MNNKQRLLSESSETAAPSDSPSDLPTELARLKRQVRSAIDEIRRLRAENQELKDRLSQIEDDPSSITDETLLAFDQDPDQLRQHIQQFIDTIDRHLEVSSSTEE